MNNNFFKNFIIFLFIVCLCFSFSLSASAVVPPFSPAVPVGADPFVFSSLFSDLMGVHYSYDEISSSGLETFFKPNAREMNGLIWVGSIANGLVHLFGDNNLLQYFGGGASDKITDLGIISDSSGSAYSFTGSVFHGLPLSPVGSSLFSPGISTQYVDTTSVGSVYHFSFDEYAIDITITRSRYGTYDFYKNSTLISSQPNTFLPASNSVSLIFKCTSSDPRVYFGLRFANSSYLETQAQTGESASVESQTIDYTSETVDTTILNNLPSTAGFEAVFPYNDESDLDSLVKDLADRILSGDTTSVQFQIVDDPPAPEPYDQTISDTSYSTLNETFNEFKEFFGDIYDGITGFQESFGDWVDDVASGWTEVFGDIYSDLHGFKESFGDWVDDVASGWTEIFGDIYSTLSGTIADTLSTISSGIQSIVQSIENADFGFVDAFWKNFLAPFNSLFNTIKSHLSIWHYVVEWLASISSVFTFYLGVFSGAGNTFLLPIYACFAGTVVIAVYRRFGK